MTLKVFTAQNKMNSLLNGLKAVDKYVIRRGIAKENAISRTNKIFNSLKNKVTDSYIKDKITCDEFTDILDELRTLRATKLQDVEYIYSIVYFD